MRLASLAPEHVELEMPFLPTNVTHGSIVHGGVIATLIDIAGARRQLPAPVPTSEGRGDQFAVHPVPGPGTGRGAARGGHGGAAWARQVVTDVSVYAEAPDEGVLVAKALMSSAMF